MQSQCLGTWEKGSHRQREGGTGVQGHRERSVWGFSNLGLSGRSSSWDGALLPNKAAALLQPLPLTGPAITMDRKAFWVLLPAFRNLSHEFYTLWGTQAPECAPWNAYAPSSGLCHYGYGHPAHPIFSYPGRSRTENQAKELWGSLRR